MKLHLGVNDVPEIQEGATTYSVGQDLERRYGIFSMFYNTYEDFIVENIEQDIAKATQNIMQGNPVIDPFSKTNQEISTKMHDFITSREVEQVAAGLGEFGIPTQAALDGVTTRTTTGKTVKRVRKGQKYVTKATGVRRASFVDSGIFVASLKGWISV